MVRRRYRLDPASSCSWVHEESRNRPEGSQERLLSRPCHLFQSALQNGNIAQYTCEFFNVQLGSIGWLLGLLYSFMMTSYHSLRF